MELKGIFGYHKKCKKNCLLPVWRHNSRIFQEILRFVNKSHTKNRTLQDGKKLDLI